MAVFVWNIENNGTEHLDISIAFAFKNGRGVKEDAAEICQNNAFTNDEGGKQVAGVTIRQKMRNMSCVYGVASSVKVLYKDLVLISKSVCSMEIIFCKDIHCMSIDLKY